MRRLVAALGAALSLVGCAAQAPYVVTEDGPVRAWVVGSAEEGAEARVAGTARWLAAERCWVLELEVDQGADPRSTWRAIVWPRGTRIASQEPPTLEVGGKRVIDGTPVTTSGRYVVPQDLPHLTIPPPCAPAGIVIMSKPPS